MPTYGDPTSSTLIDVASTYDYLKLFREFFNEIIFISFGQVSNSNQMPLGYNFPNKTHCV